MLRGTEIIFAAFLAVVWLKRSLSKLNYYGMATCVAGSVLVGIACVESGSSGAGEQASKLQIPAGHEPHRSKPGRAGALEPCALTAQTSP